MATEKKDESKEPGELVKAWAIVKALLDPSRRGKVLTRFARFVGKMLLAGVVVSVLIASGEVWQAGPTEAWRAHAWSWFLIPVGVVLVPLVFGLVPLVSEAAAYLLFLVFALPSLLFKDEDRWFRILRWLGGLAILGFFVWFLFEIGVSIVDSGPTDSAVPTPDLPTAVPPVCRPEPSAVSYIATVDWLKGHPWIAAALAVPASVFLTSGAKDLYAVLKQRLTKGRRTFSMEDDD